MTPRFSIVLPVRNGGEHVKLCVASILAQTLADDYELLVLENGSTDGTAEWLADLRDPRVRLHPAERPLSIVENWTRILQVPRAEYMTIIGHDDLLDPDYLATMCALVESHPDAGLYQAHFRLIDTEGRFLRPCLPMPFRETAAEFLAVRLLNIRDTFGTGYLMRTADYDRVGGIPPFVQLMAADDVLWLRLMEGTWKATTSRELFSYRTHRQSTSGSSNPTTYLEARELYHDALEELAARDPALCDVLAHYGPVTYPGLGEYLHKRFLLWSLAGKGRYTDEEAARIRRLVERAAGPEAARVRRKKRLRLLEWANHLPGGRPLYRAVRSLARFAGRGEQFID